MKAVATEKAPKALGPYSQGYVHGGIFYSAGQIPINPETDTIEAVTIEEQTEQVCKNLGAVLEAANCGVHLVATIHGESPERFRRRAVYRELCGVFDHLVALHPDKSCNRERMAL